MKGMITLIREGIVFQGVLVLVVSGSVCYLALTGAVVPEVLTAGFGMIIGYFFANTGRVQTTNGIEKYLRSLGIGKRSEGDSS